MNEQWKPKAGEQAPDGRWLISVQDAFDNKPFDDTTIVWNRSHYGKGEMIVTGMELDTVFPYDKSEQCYILHSLGQPRSEHGVFGWVMLEMRPYVPLSERAVQS